MPGAVKALQDFDEIAARHGVKVLGFYSTAPAHSDIYTLEADSLTAVTGFVGEGASTAYGQADFEVVPVVSREDLLQMAQAMMEQQ